MYKTFKLTIQKRDEIKFIEYLSGVHQGDNLAPLLFVLVFQAAMESLDACSGDLNPSLPFRFFTDTKNDSKSRGRLTGQRPAKGEKFSFARSIYVDDKAALYETRKAAEDGLSLIKSHLLRFGLIMHSGTIDKRSKTEVIHVLAERKKAPPKMPKT